MFFFIVVRLWDMHILLHWMRWVHTYRVVSCWPQCDLDMCAVWIINTLNTVSISHIGHICLPIWWYCSTPGELFVHFASSTPPHRVGFQTAEDVFESSLTMYFEASSFGLGLNDSKSLAPPLRIHALPSPLSTASASTPLTSCKCDHVATGVHYLLGVINNPFFGHVLANTLSNLFATLYLKRIDPKVGVWLTTNWLTTWRTTWLADGGEKAEVLV